MKTNTNVQTFRIQFIFQLATMISDVTKHKNNPPEMIYVQTVQRAASQSKGSFAPWVWSSSLIISVQLFQFFLLIRYHQSPKPADGILNFAGVFGLFSTQHPGPESPWARGRQFTKVQTPARSRGTILCSNIKCQKTFKWYFITACTAEWWKAISWKQVGWPVLFFAEGRISALSSASCSSSVW